MQPAKKVLKQPPAESENVNSEAALLFSPLPALENVYDIEHPTRPSHSTPSHSPFVNIVNNYHNSNPSNHQISHLEPPPMHVLEGESLYLGFDENNYLPLFSSHSYFETDNEWIPMSENSNNNNHNNNSNQSNPLSNTSNPPALVPCCTFTPFEINSNSNSGFESGQFT